jgi:hypothetical protein
MLLVCSLGACSQNDAPDASPAAAGSRSSSAADSGMAPQQQPAQTQSDAGPVREDAGKPATDTGAPGEPAAARDAGTDAQASDAAQVDVEGFSRGLAAALCESLKTCLGEQKLRTFVKNEDCETRFAASFAQGDFATLQDSVERGRVEVRPEAVDKCYADTRAMGCAIHTERLPASCQEAFAGQVAAGGTCTSGNDCAGKSYCPTTACPRACTARHAAAESCTRDEECESGLICAQSVCAKPAALGAACAGTSGGQCALGSSCVGSTKEQAGRCVANAEVQAGAIGDVCTPGGTLCREGLSCAFDGNEGFSCQRASASGEACHLALPTQCPAAEYCTAEDVTTEGRCAALPTDGQPCVLGSECAGGHVCMSAGESAVVCKRVRDLAEACEADAMCRSGRCAQGKCAAIDVCD